MCVKCMFLFGWFFTICHPYIDVHFLKCFFCDLFLPFFLGGGGGGGGNLFIMMV